LFAKGNKIYLLVSLGLQLMYVMSYSAMVGHTIIRWTQTKWLLWLCKPSSLQFVFQCF